ncbi:DNA-directed RNA polymerase subunit beta', partial [Candidatus Saccharibacteria bacterium]|nr:DNA-directed RNA polymerase subunit beta' [Candidatus Saccharibacteria bacterium]
RGARQGQVSTALRTADSGYLTRRLVDVAQDVFTTDKESDDPGFTVYKKEVEDAGVEFSAWISGRYAAEAIPGYVDKDEVITKEMADAISADDKIEYVKIYSILTTKSLDGIPQKAYGIDMSTRELVAPFQPVGVIAAQSLGEPGTQLTLDTKHGSGVAGSGAIARGLPRVEELLEARTPKGQAFVTPIAGVVKTWEDGNHYIVEITPDSGDLERLELDGRKPKVKDGQNVKAGDVLTNKPKGKEPLVATKDGNVQLVEGAIILVSVSDGPVRIEIPNEAELLVKNDDRLERGDRLTTGSLNLQDLLKYKGREATARYIMNDVLSVYAAQGHEISAKHLEIIVRQMFSRVMIDNPGDSTLVAGDIISEAAVARENRELELEGKEPVEYTNLLLGITKVSIWSDSFLSAASFQDTTRVLINSAISGRIDRLHGLKENVIIGRKIPVGTGKIALPDEPEEENLEEDSELPLEPSEEDLIS